MDDAGVRRHDAEISERVLPPPQERIALAVARELELGVQLKRVAAAEVVNLHGVIDDELDGLQRVDAIGIAAEANHAVAHRGEIDDARDAGEVLQQHARGRKRDFFLQLRARFPARERLDVLGVHEARIFVPQQVFEKNFQRVRKPRDVRKGLLELVQAEDLDRFTGERALRAGVERICAAHLANPIKSKESEESGRVWESERVGESYRVEVVAGVGRLTSDALRLERRKVRRFANLLSMSSKVSTQFLNS